MRKIRIVERLKESAERHLVYARGTYGKRANIFGEQAAQDLRDASLIEELAEALEPFAKEADLNEEMGDTRPVDPDGDITVADLRRARSARSKLYGGQG